jgi:RNA polymerase sigma factor (sigma-70 family)
LNSVSQWIHQLKAGEADAAQQLWDRYAAQLVAAARRKLGDAPKRAADEEDVAQSVFNSLCRGAAAGRIQNVRTRDDLWWLLLAITRQKVVDHIRRETAEKRGAGRVLAETACAAGPTGAFSLDQLMSEEPTPDYLVALAEEHRRLLGLLRDDRLRRIAESRIEGYTVEEIAADLSISTRSVERKLQLIRNVWTRELDERTDR